jgi:2-polyprenyl-6-methoxyphenol hydroxylase-like FAD-dependent oxidoreductase
MRLLYQALPNKEMYLVGAEFERFEEDATGVTVYLKNGGTLRGDILIGADGTRSKVAHQIGCVMDRQILSKKQNKIHFVSFICCFICSFFFFFSLPETRTFLGYCQAFEDPPEIKQYTSGQRKGALRWYHARGRTIGTYFWGHNNTGFWYTTHDDLILGNEPDWFGDTDLEAKRKLLLENLKGVDDYIVGLAKRATKLIPIRLQTKKPNPKGWHKGRVVIIGDAVHAFVP